MWLVVEAQHGVFILTFCDHGALVVRFHRELDDPSRPKQTDARCILP